MFYLAIIQNDTTQELATFRSELVMAEMYEMIQALQNNS